VPRLPLPVCEPRNSPKNQSTPSAACPGPTPVSGAAHAPWRQRANSCRDCKRNRGAGRARVRSALRAPAELGHRLEAPTHLSHYRSTEPLIDSARRGPYPATLTEPLVAPRTSPASLSARTPVGTMRGGQCPSSPHHVRPCLYRRRRQAIPSCCSAVSPATVSPDAGPRALEAAPRTDLAKGGVVGWVGGGGGGGVGGGTSFFFPFIFLFFFFLSFFCVFPFFSLWPCRGARLPGRSGSLARWPTGPSVPRCHNREHVPITSKAGQGGPCHYELEHVLYRRVAVPDQNPAGRRWRSSSTTALALAGAESSSWRPWRAAHPGRARRVRPGALASLLSTTLCARNARVTGGSSPIVPRIQTVVSLVLMPSRWPVIPLERRPLRKWAR